MSAPRKLAAVVGAAAAAMLLTLTPMEESGRTVDVQIAADGSATVTHIAGPQYLRAYLDIVGVATACDGLTYYANGKRVRAGDRFTESQCTKMLEAALVQHAETVMACTPFDKGRDAYQIVAAVSMDYNTGGWCGSTARKRWAAGNRAGSCDALLWWNKAGGRAVTGLTRRRNRERQYCLTNIAPGAAPANLKARLEPWQ